MKRKEPKPEVVTEYQITVEPTVEYSLYQWKSTLSKCVNGGYGTHTCKTWLPIEMFLSKTRQGAIDQACGKKDYLRRVEQCKAQREVVECP